jgi:Phage integrase, N-terminal SAM-like domain
MRSDLTLLPVGGAPAVGLTHALTSAAGYALSENADATRRAYRADIRRFSTWCEAVGAIALPATPATVAAYLAALADLRLRVPTISRRAAAIAYAHKLASFEPAEQRERQSGHARGAPVYLPVTRFTRRS